MAKKEPKIEQPSSEAQKQYASLVANDATVVSILGTNKKYKLRWLRNSQLEKLGRLMLHKAATDEKDHELSVLEETTEDAKIACKAAAIYVTNGGWLRLKLFYGILWRWFYYVKEYSAMQLAEILEVGKKKIPLTQFFLITMSLTEAKDTLMMMRMEEAERILREQSGERSSATGRNSNGSSSQGTSSSV